MTAQGCSSAELYSAHDPQLRAAERASVHLSVCRAMAAEDIRHL
jgi:hypothetical protein